MKQEIHCKYQKKKKEKTPNPIKFKKKNSEIVSDITDKSASK